MIQAFKHCRPVLSVDGTFLTGMHKGQVLTCIGVDANNKVVPIAFAFVESENAESWLWSGRWFVSGQTCMYSMIAIRAYYQL